MRLTTPRSSRQDATDAIDDRQSGYRTPGRLPAQRVIAQRFSALALPRPCSMSAVWSLSGVKRTSQFKNGTSVCDPKRSSLWLSICAATWGTIGSDPLQNTRCSYSAPKKHCPATTQAGLGLFGLERHQRQACDLRLERGLRRHPAVRSSAIGYGGTSGVRQ
jgi:hypothetical protein